MSQHCPGTAAYRDARRHVAIAGFQANAELWRKQLGKADRRESAEAKIAYMKELIENTTRNLSLGTCAMGKPRKERNTVPSVPTESSSSEPAA